MVSTILSTVFAAILSLFAYAQWRKYRANPRRLPPPPGPEPHFPFGNLKELPSGGQEWKAYQALSKTHNSDVVFLSVLGTPLLSINSFQAASDLLDKKGVVYSDRPRLPMIKELMGWDWNLVLMSYHEGFATHRRIVQQHFQPNVVAKLHHPVMTNEVQVLLGSLLRTPDQFIDHLKRMAGAVIMMVTYGHQVAPEGDEYIELAEEVRKHSEETPGAALVDTLPILKYIPTWFPGASFKKVALHRRRLAEQMRNAPYQMVKRQMAAGNVVPSMVSSLMEDKFSEGGGEEDEVIKNCGGVVYSAGADTTATALTNFFLAMIMYPEVQERAQRELDDVVGRTRLPSFEDKPNLDYLQRVLKETLRWKSVTPLGVPHCTTGSDEYRGWHIPPKTTVLANIWAMLHDESVYEQPDVFNPDRFISHGDKPADPDPTRAAFGFGRRICPGRFFAEDSVWLAMACILHVFTIKKVIDADGQEVQPEVEWSSGLVSIPSAFKCTIRPRFVGAEQMCSGDVE